MKILRNRRGGTESAALKWKKGGRAAVMLTALLLPVQLTAYAAVITAGSGSTAAEVLAAEQAEAAAPAASAAEQTNQEEQTETFTILSDAVHAILDADFYSQYASGDPEEGVRTLIENGGVYVNGSQVGKADFTINGGKALWEDEDGTWGYRAHIMFRGDGLSWEEASLTFVNRLSLLKGSSYELTVADGAIRKLAFFVQDTVFAETVTSADGYTHLTITAGSDGSMERANPAEIAFPDGLVEPDSAGNMPADQTAVIYWEDTEGWHLKRADSEVIAADGDTEVDGAFVNREYTEACSRPTQPVQALGWTDTSAELVVWYYADGLAACVTHADGRADLYVLLEKAEELLDSTPVYADGAQAAAGEAWVTQAYHDTFAAEIADAQATAAADGLYNSAYDSALFALSQAYGGDGSMYAAEGNVFADGIGFKTLAGIHAGQN